MIVKTKDRDITVSDLQLWKIGVVNFCRYEDERPFAAQIHIITIIPPNRLGVPKFSGR